MDVTRIQPHRDRHSVPFHHFHDGSPSILRTSFGKEKVEKKSNIIDQDAGVKRNKQVIEEVDVEPRPRDDNCLRFSDDRSMTLTRQHVLAGKMMHDRCEMCAL